MMLLTIDEGPAENLETFIPIRYVFEGALGYGPKTIVSLTTIQLWTEHLPAPARMEKTQAPILQLISMQ